MNARKRIERAFHVSFKLPDQAAELLDAYRNEVLTQMAIQVREYCPDHGDTTTCRIACHCVIADELMAAHTLSSEES